MNIYQLYLDLLEKYGTPSKEFWQMWCKRDKTRLQREEVVLGAVLTQRTSWKNVEKALDNLRRAQVLSIKGVYKIGAKKMKRLEELIRPSGFYKQKARRLFRLCRYIIEQHKSLDKFFKQDLAVCRAQLLGLSGVGPETADSILLYAGDKPIFVIDEYTRRFVKKYNLSQNFSYGHLQDLFHKNLPRRVAIYQDFHAMIVLDGKKGIIRRQKGNCSSV